MAQESRTVSLYETIKEVVQHEEDVLALDALIRARFHLIEKDGATSDGLPVYVSVRMGKLRYAFSVNDSGEIPSGASLVEHPSPDYGGKQQ